MCNQYVISTWASKNTNTLAGCESERLSSWESQRFNGGFETLHEGFQPCRQFGSCFFAIWSDGVMMFLLRVSMSMVLLVDIEKYLF